MVVYFLLVRRLLVVDLKFFVVKVDDVINDVEIGIEVVVGGNVEVKQVIKIGVGVDVSILG